jgi:hypothetical protein
MTNDRVEGIVTHMRRWLELTVSRPLDQYALDREAVSQLVARLSVEPKAECVPVDGDLDARGISWRLVTMEAVTTDELRAIASQIHAAATALENR